MSLARDITRKIISLRVFMLVLMAVAAVSFVPDTFADGADIEVTLVAAAPESYDHEVGGGAFNDGTDAANGDYQLELQGPGLTCGDIISYLALIEVDEQASASDQVAELTFDFGTEPTGQPGYAHIEVVQAAINYGRVENGDSGTGINPGAGGFGLDSAINDDRQTIATGDSGSGGSQMRYQTAFEPAGSTPFNGADGLILTAQIDDLDPGETVVLRMDVATQCLANSTPRGVLRTTYDNGYVIAENGQSITPDPISGANQTIKLKRLAEATGINSPVLIITHSVMEIGGQCGIDDSEQLTIHPGQEVTYCVTVKNLGTTPLFDVTAQQTNGALSDIFLPDLMDIDGEGDSGDLAANTTVTGTYNMVYTAAGNDARIVQATGTNGEDGSGLVALSDADTASVIVSAPTAIELSTINSATVNSVQATALMIAILGSLGLFLASKALRNGGLLLPRHEGD